MKYLALLIMLMSLSLKATDEDFQGLPARLLTFSKDIPIELDEINRQALLQDQTDEFKRNVEEQFEKTVPWQKVLSALFIISLLFVLKNLPKVKEKGLKNDIKTAKTKALLKLQAVDMSNLSKDEAYQNLSDILRNFIEESYGISAPKKTTEEFLNALQDESFPLPFSFPKEALSRFLLESDLVKFAKHTPKKEAASNAYMLVKSFIET